VNSTDAKSIACGNRAAHGKSWGVQHHHGSTAEVRQCFATPGGILSHEEADQEQAAAVEAASDPDLAYERHLESAGYNEARAQEDHEAALGVPFYEEARDAAALVAYANADGSIVIPDEDGMEPLVIGPKVEQPALDVEVKPDFAGLPDGLYTVEVGSEHRTFQVKTQKPDAQFAPGQRILSVLSGPDNTHDYLGIAFVSTDGHGVHHLRPWKRFHDAAEVTKVAAQRLLEDPRAALTAGRCFRCQRPLTTPESLARGMGDHCAGKAGL